MLRVLVERYLDNLARERDFDSTFIALLAAEGFFDVHFTHGGLEFGKDFIAKKTEGGVTYQYAFQNKVGDMRAAEWRGVRQQVFETLTNDLGPPSFDPVLPRRTVLVLTGRLGGSAGVDHQQFAQTMNSQFVDRAVLPQWDRETLVELLLKHGPEQLFTTDGDIGSYGAFYRLYGDIVESRARVDDVEKHFEERLRAVVPPEERLAAVGLEAHLLADVARATGQPYLALQAMLAGMRAVVYEMQLGHAAGSEVLLESALADVSDAARFVLETYDGRVRAAGGLFDAGGGAGLFVTYPILCAQLMDALVLRHSLGTPDEADPAASALARLVEAEPGCAHAISDRYAVSIAWAIRTLWASGHATQARALLKESALWLVDRYWQEGPGLAPCDAGEDEEIAQLLGAPFSGIKVRRSSGSLLACALMDAACLLQDGEIYDGLHRDILAADIVPRYYQARNTPGQFAYLAEDVVRFPNVEFADTMPPFDSFSHGNHLHGEATPALAGVVGDGVFAGVSLLMRDRYFPQTWTK